MTALTLLIYGRVCHLCLKPGATTRDHIIPLGKGGLDVIENCRPAHLRCNSRRQDRDLTPEVLEEFRPTIEDIAVDASELFENEVPRTPRAGVLFLPEPQQKTTERDSTETRAG